MPVFYEDDRLKYDISFWRRRHRLHDKLNHITAIATASDIQCLHGIFSYLKVISPGLSQHERDQFALWSYRYFGYAVLGHDKARIAFHKFAPDEFIAWVKVTEMH